MQKLPEVFDRKNDDACVRKRGPPDRSRRLIHFRAVTGKMTTPCYLVEDDTHLSLDEALTSPFTSSKIRLRLKKKKKDF